MGSKDNKILKLYEKAQELIDEDELDEAIKIYDKILKIDPLDYRAWLDRGYAFLQLEKFEEALDSYNKAIEIKPKDTNAWYNKGIALSELERFEEAVEVFTILLEITPTDIEALRELGRVFYEMERWDDAIHITEKELALDPEDSEGWAYWAYAKLMLGQLDEAKKGFLKNLEFDPSNDTGLYNLACITSLQNNVRDALKYLKKAVSLNDSWYKEAKDDEDFKNIRDTDEFKELLNYQKPEFESPLDELRYRLIELIEPSDLRISPSEELPRVWAVLVDMPIADTWVSLICIAEGSVSLYFGTGGGIIGAGEHESVWLATKKYLMKAEEIVDKMKDFKPVKLESLEKVTFHVLMHEGKRTDSAKEEELVLGEEFTDHYLSELYHLAQDVISEIRLHSPGPE